VANVIAVIHFVSTGLTLLVVVDIFVSYFLSPHHPVRQSLDMLVQPMLAPIRRLLPQTGPLDFSPLVLIFLIWIVETLLINILA
jgi:YggT family protein